MTAMKNPSPPLARWILGAGIALGAMTAVPAVEITITCGPSGSDVEFCLKHAQAWAAKTGNTIKNFSPPTSPTEKLALYRQLFAGDEAGMERFLAEICSPAWNHALDAGRPYAEAVAERAGGNRLHRFHMAITQLHDRTFTKSFFDLAKCRFKCFIFVHDIPQMM
mgnify:CR=1 FL=1